MKTTKSSPDTVASGEGRRLSTSHESPNSDREVERARSPHPVTVTGEAVAAAHQAILGRIVAERAARAGLEAALPYLTSGQSEVEHELSHRREDSPLAREAMERLSVVQAERDDALAVIERVRELAEGVSWVAVHVGGGNLVDRRRMVDVADLLALLPDTPNDERSTT